MFNWRNLSWKHLFVVLLLLHILPLWIFAYFPSQDGASHVYNGLVLKEYGKHENYKMRDAWQLNITDLPELAVSHYVGSISLCVPTCHRREGLPYHRDRHGSVRFLLFSQCCP